MRSLVCVFVLIQSISYSMIIKDKSVKSSKDNNISIGVMPPYNPYSIYVPSSDTLKKLPADRVLDMGASAYSINHMTKALYFYTNAVILFPDDVKIVSWSYYEAAYIYYRKRQFSKSLEYLDKIQQIKGQPTTIQNLTKKLIHRIQNPKEYKAIRKQEDLLFIGDRKAKAEFDKQLAKEEHTAEKAQRQITKDRKQREKEEKKAEKKIQKQSK